MREIRDTKSSHFSVPMSEKGTGVRLGASLDHTLYIKLGADIGKPSRLYVDAAATWLCSSQPDPSTIEGQIKLHWTFAQPRCNLANMIVRG